jgi:hypothetical protein
MGRLLFWMPSGRNRVPRSGISLGRQHAVPPGEGVASRFLCMQKCRVDARRCDCSARQLTCRPRQSICRGRRWRCRPRQSICRPRRWRCSARRPCGHGFPAENAAFAPKVWQLLPSVLGGAVMVVGGQGGAEIIFCSARCWWFQVAGRPARRMANSGSHSEQGSQKVFRSRTGRRFCRVMTLAPKSFFMHRGKIMVRGTVGADWLAA